jgi:prophage regulatory protein
MTTEDRPSILRLREVKAVTGLGRSTIYLYIGQGKFPKQRKLGERAVGWLSTDVFRWVSERGAAY